MARHNRLAVGAQGDGEVFVREGFYLINQGNTDPYNTSEAGLFDKPETPIRTDATPEVSVRLPSTCSLELTERCRPDLDLCLLRRPTHRDVNSICGCYLEHGQCFVTAGCREALSDELIGFCFETMRCRRTQCDGTSASASVVSAAALLVAALMTLRGAAAW